jgi:hypothetical protein
MGSSKLIESHFQRFGRHLNRPAIWLIELLCEKNSTRHRKSRSEERANYDRIARRC